MFHASENAFTNASSTPPDIWGMMQNWSVNVCKSGITEHAV